MDLVIQGEEASGLAGDDSVRDLDRGTLPSALHAVHAFLFAVIRSRSEGYRCSLEL